MYPWGIIMIVGGLLAALAAVVDDGWKPEDASEKTRRQTYEDQTASSTSSSRASSPAFRPDHGAADDGHTDYSATSDHDKAAHNDCGSGHSATNYVPCRSRQTILSGQPP